MAARLRGRATGARMVLGILLAAAIGLGVILGLLAEMPAKQIVLQCAAMGGAALVFYGLVNLL